MDEMEYVDSLADAEQTLPAIHTKSIDDIKREHRQSMSFANLPVSIPIPLPVRRVVI